MGVLGLMILVAIAIPISSKLVLNNQDNRSLAVGLNQSCTVESDCISPYVCYGNSNKVCKVKSGGACSHSSDCYGNHYCSAYNNCCRKIDSKWINDSSVEGKSVKSMSGVKAQATRAAAKKLTPTVTPTLTTAPTPIVTLTPTTAPTPTVIQKAGLSFKFSIYGIKPESICLADLTNFELKVVNVSKGTVNLTDNLRSEKVIGEVNSDGDQVFELKVDLTEIGGDLGMTNNYIFLDGNQVLRKKFCRDKQTKKLDEQVACEIDLTSDKIYDFSEYGLWSGDTNGDRKINGLDYSLIKNAFGEEVVCGKPEDLNFDGGVNSLDLQLIKQALFSVEDE